jgi:hypothetical protein
MRPLISLMTPKLSCIWVSLLWYKNGLRLRGTSCVALEGGGELGAEGAAPNSMTNQERRSEIMPRTIITDPKTIVAEANRISFTR